MHTTVSHLLQSPQSHRQRIRWVVVSLAVWVCLTAAGSWWTPCCWQARLDKHQEQPLSQTHVNKEPKEHAHPHMHSYSNTNLYLITHAHTGRTLRTNTQSGSESAAGKIQAGNWYLRRQIGRSLRQIGGSLRLNLWHKTNIKRDRQTPGWKASWSGPRQHPSPSPGLIYITFSFSFFKWKARQGQD